STSRPAPHPKTVAQAVRAGHGSVAAKFGSNTSTGRCQGVPGRDGVSAPKTSSSSCMNHENEKFGHDSARVGRNPVGGRVDCERPERLADYGAVTERGDTRRRYQVGTVAGIGSIRSEGEVDAHRRERNDRQIVGGGDGEGGGEAAARKVALQESDGTCCGLQRRDAGDEIEDSIPVQPG